MALARTITCRRCKIDVAATSGQQKFCRDCRLIVKREQVRRWNRENRERRLPRLPVPRLPVPCKNCGVIIVPHNAQKFCLACSSERKKYKPRPPRIITCQLCGVNVLPTAPAQRFCPDCRPAAKIDKDDRWRAANRERIRCRDKDYRARDENKARTVVFRRCQRCDSLIHQPRGPRKLCQTCCSTARHEYEHEQQRRRLEQQRRRLEQDRGGNCRSCGSFIANSSAGYVRKFCSTCRQVHRYRAVERSRKKKREEKRRYYATNPEKRREERRRYYAAHPEKKREKSRRYYAAHPEKARERSRRHYICATALEEIFFQNEPVRSSEDRQKRRAALVIKARELNLI